MLLYCFSLLSIARTNKKLCIFFSSFSLRSTYHGSLLQVRPAKRNHAVLPGAQSKGQPLPWKQTRGQWGQVQMPIRRQCADLWVCRKKRKWERRGEVRGKSRVVEKTRKESSLNKLFVPLLLRRCFHAYRIWYSASLYYIIVLKWCYSLLREAEEGLIYTKSPYRGQRGARYTERKNCLPEFCPFSNISFRRNRSKGTINQKSISFFLVSWHLKAVYGLRRGRSDMTRGLSNVLLNATLLLGFGSWWVHFCCAYRKKRRDKWIGKWHQSCII